MAFLALGVAYLFVSVKLKLIILVSLTPILTLFAITAQVPEILTHSDGLLPIFELTMLSILRTAFFTLPILIKTVAFFTLVTLVFYAVN